MASSVSQLGIDRFYQIQGCFPSHAASLFDLQFRSESCPLCSIYGRNLCFFSKPRFLFQYFVSGRYILFSVIHSMISDYRIFIHPCNPLISPHFSHDTGSVPLYCNKFQKVMIKWKNMYGSSNMARCCARKRLFTTTIFRMAWFQ